MTSSELNTMWYDNFPLCERCGQRTGGSHYHCGQCDSLETTSMYGHYHSLHIEPGFYVETEPHMRCTQEACDNAKVIKRRKMA